MDPFSCPPVQNETRLPKNCHMPGNFGLRLGGGSANITYAHLPRFPEQHQDSQAGFIRQYFEKLNRL